MPCCKSRAANNLTRAKGDIDARRLLAFNYKRKKEVAHCVSEKVSIKVVNLFKITSGLSADASTLQMQN